MKKKDWSKEDCIKEGLKYDSKTKFSVQSPLIYRYAYKNGWLNECCSHMVPKKKPDGYWIKPRCQYEANKYKNRTEFSKHSGGAYTIAKRKGWLDEICSHMIIKSGNQKRMVYAFEFKFADIKRVYVGLTCNIDRRAAEHLSEDGPVSIHVKSGYQYDLIHKSDYIDINQAMQLEKKTIEKYRSEGWAILNTKKGGEIGGHKLKWDFENCREEALKYSTRIEFERGTPGAYNSARKFKWLDQICSHMRQLQHPKNYWTSEECRKEALKFDSRTKFHKKSGSAYSAAGKLGILDEICAHMLLPVKILKWTKEACKIEALKYQTRCDFKKKAAGAHSAAVKNKFLNEICTHMVEARKNKDHWNKERCHEEALKYTSRGEFQKNKVSAYRKAYNNGWLNEICSHMLETRKPNNFWTKESCHIEALKFNTKNEFMKKSNSAYAAAHRKGWLSEICSHMKELKKPNNYYTFDMCLEAAKDYKTKKDFRENAKHIYICAQRRKWLSKICIHMKLRKPSSHWTKENCIEEASKYHSRTEFNKNSSTAATIARGWDWFEEVWDKSRIIRQNKNVSE